MKAMLLSFSITLFDDHWTIKFSECSKAKSEIMTAPFRGAHAIFQYCFITAGRQGHQDGP